MSGGVGPTSDITFPKEHEHEQESKPQNLNQPKTSSSFSLSHLNALAVIVVLAASGMVSPQDLAFVLLSFPYLHFISKFAFPTTSSSTLVFSKQNNLLRIYVTAGAIIGLLLPIAYIFHGIFEGDKRGINTASPHVFLLASQVFMEGVAFRDGFSIPVRVFVPVFYNSRRIFTIVEWLTSEFEKEYREDGGSVRMLYMGRGLAIANMAFCLGSCCLCIFRELSTSTTLLRKCKTSENVPICVLLY